MSVAAARAALRIARRDALRAKGRSVLVVAMIGLPMLTMAFADVAVRTGQLPPAEVARREIGTADLVADAVANGPITQRSMNDFAVDTVPRPAAKPPTVADLAALLPPGSRVVVRDLAFGVSTSTADRAITGPVSRFDLADPLARGTVRLRAGHYPANDGEVALAVNAAHLLDVHVGDTVGLGEPKRPMRVSGIVVDPTWLASKTAYVLPSVQVAARDDGLGPRAHRFAVDLPPGTRDVDLVATLNAHGYLVTPRTWYFDPPPGGRGVDPAAAGATVLVVGLATLEVVLLAGTAFAVGARRSTHDLALIAATGGDRKDVRRVVLAGAVVLGAVAGVVGITGGIAIAVFARPLALDRLSGTLAGPLDVRPLELGAVVVIAIGTALLAALLPAVVTARQPVVAALTGRRGQARTSRRLPIVGLLAVAAGTALAFHYGRRASLAHRVVAGQATDSSGGKYFDLVLLGAVVAELGFVACAPALVALVGRLAGRLPLAPRLALRDAARHRTRSGPAVAAVVAAVAGSVAISVYVSSDTEQMRRTYVPFVPAGTVEVAYKPRVLTADEAAQLRAALPVKDQVDHGVVGAFCDRTAACDRYTLAIPAESCPRVVPGDVVCGGSSHESVGVGAPALVGVFTGRDDPAVDAALRDGAVAVFDARWVRDGHVTIVSTGVSVSLPAVVVHATGKYQQLPEAVLTPETARAHGLPFVTIATYFTTTRMPTAVEEAQARAVEVRYGIPGDVYVERGFVDSKSLALLVLLAASSVITLGATSIATGLAAADSRPDLATLAAVGAPGGVRRRLAMAQAATVAGLGSVLGILAGVVPAAAVVAARGTMPFVLPYGTLAATAFGVPLIAAVLVGLVTRSRLPMQQRVA